VREARKEHSEAQHGMVFNWNGITWSHEGRFEDRGLSTSFEATRSALSHSEGSVCEVRGREPTCSCRSCACTWLNSASCCAMARRVSVSVSSHPALGSRPPARQPGAA
jgi:hypothetical protein